MPGFPLVPQNDNSLLLINSGMAPLKPYFTGQAVPPHERVATCQKCVRTVDIDEVGKDKRHGSFFEMLGNFSFGDYFKAEAIPWAWEFLTEVMGIPAERLYVSVFEDDDEAYGIWQHTVGLPAERIFRLGREDNFWEHGAGPCGPCSEIHFDKGEAYGCGKPGCAVGCDCDRYMEVWNLVFTQYNKRDDGSYVPLDFRNIDTGMGLERLAIVMQGVDSIFDIDTFKAIRTRVREAIGMAAQRPEGDVSVNIIADHVRSVTFIAADGVLPSNEGRGYVLRRLLRRAVRHGRLLGHTEAFISDVCQSAIEVNAQAYPELMEKRDYILTVLSVEENRFLETLDVGLTLLKEKIDFIRANSVDILSGADAFKLYDTYGFPLELMQEILADENLGLDESGFKIEMESQRARARAARQTTNYMGAAETVYHQIPPGLKTDFVGYTQRAAEAEVLALIADGAVAEMAAEGQEVSIFLSRTPFYAESGGQKSDAGLLETAHLLVDIRDCIKVAGGNTAHRGIVRHGTLRVGERVGAVVDETRRMNTARNHTATHLLQKALREVLGSHVEQAGSEVSADRLRFDFTHFAPVSPDERELVETIVNEKIMAGLPVSIRETTLEEARRLGATALFGEKYGDKVRMVDMSGFSIELCGGTHLLNTQAAGMFKIISEGGVAAGVRRIEAVTGKRALGYFREADARLQAAAAVLKTTPDNVIERAAAVTAENKQLRQEINHLKTEAAGNRDAEHMDTLLQAVVEYKGVKILTARLDVTEATALRTLSDTLWDKLGVGVMVLCGVSEGAAQFLARASEEAVKQGIHVGQIVREAATLCGGSGGGRPNAAQAGGRDITRVDEALALTLENIKKQLGN